MLNKYIKKNTSRLAEELRKESASCACLNWEESYKDARSSIERIERLEDYHEEKNTPSEIGWFVFLVVAIIAMYCSFVSWFHLPMKQMVVYAIIGSAVIVGLLLLGRFLFYHIIERRLILAENRRLTHERRFPGISNLVLDYLEKGSDEIPARIEPDITVTVINNNETEKLK